MATAQAILAQAILAQVWLRDPDGYLQVVKFIKPLVLSLWRQQDGNLFRQSALHCDPRGSLTSLVRCALLCRQHCTLCCKSLRWKDPEGQWTAVSIQETQWSSVSIMLYGPAGHCSARKGRGVRKAGNSFTCRTFPGGTCGFNELCSIWNGWTF